MDEDEFNELSDEQLAAIDEDVANLSRCTESEEDENNQNNANQTPEIAPTQFFAEVSDAQFRTLDFNIEKRCNGGQLQNDEAEELFSSFTDEQFNAMDRAAETVNNQIPQNDGNRQNRSVNESIVTASQLELAAAVFEDEENDEPTLEHLHCLRTKFNHTQFREKQWEIIDAVMNKRQDVSAVMATGYGKSLCFQFPAVYKNGIVLVICPLISLMQAQVIALEKLKIKACYTGSAQSDQSITSRIERGEFTVVYSTPEFLQGYQGKRMLHALNNRLTLIAIDESHCVSNWGFDFRPNYRRLNIIRATIPNTPILAMTATATEKVRHDIRSSLQLKNPREIMTSFDRPNLEFIVCEKSNSYIWTENVSTDLRPWITQISGSVIIYVLRREESEKICQNLRAEGINCAFYHAGMDDFRRNFVLKSFLDGNLKLIVATSAFGMGIDKKDIRAVIHYGAAKNLEHYYQEVGRAGRDGLPSKVITFFELNDFDLHDWFLAKEDGEMELSNFVKGFLQNLALKLREFLHSTKCRRKMILQYFGEDSSSLEVRSDCCDNCARGLSSWRHNDLYYGFSGDELYNFTRDGLLLFDTIKQMTDKKVTPYKKSIIKVLRGEENSRFSQIANHGKGKIRVQYYWNALIDHFMSTEYIEPVVGKKCLRLSNLAIQWVANPSRKILLQRPQGAIYRFFNPKRNTPFSNIRWNRSYREDGHAAGEYNGSTSAIDLFFGQCVWCE